MWNMAVISLVLLSFVLGTCEFIMIGIVPDISESLSVPLTQAGMLISYFALAYAVMTPILSIWGSQFPRYRFLITLVALFIAGNVACLFVDDYLPLLLDRIFLASLSGVTLSVSTTFAPDIAPRKYLPSVMAWIFAGFSIAAVLGVPIGTLAASYVSWKYIFLVIAVIGAGNLLLMMRYLPRGAGEKQQIDLKREMSLLADRRILIGMGIAVFALAGNYAWYAYVTPILETVAGMDAAWVSPFLFLFGAMTIVSNLSSGRVAAMGGMYILWPILAAETGIVLALFFALSSLWAAAAVILVLGAFIYIYNSSIQIYFLHISAVFHPGTMLMAGALLPTAANIGIAVGTTVGSITAETLGLAAAPLPGACMMAASALLGWYLMKPERERMKRISFQRMKGE